MAMAGYTKLFSSIVTSTIWREPKETKVLWITMLALADKEGFVDGTIPGLAAMANLTIEETETALAHLLGPDRYSRTQDFEGRRIEPRDGGWHLINHAKYRAALGKDERREYMKLHMRAKRSKQPLAPVIPKLAELTQAEAATEAEAYPFQSETFIAVWADWIGYRKERRLSAYVPRGKKAIFGKLGKMGEARAIAAIEFSIAQQYQGIFEPTHGYTKPRGDLPTSSEAEARRNAI